jgi:hypothetical protein
MFDYNFHTLNSLSLSLSLSWGSGMRRFLSSFYLQKHLMENVTQRLPPTLNSLSLSLSLSAGDALVFIFALFIETRDRAILDILQITFSYLFSLSGWGCVDFYPQFIYRNLRWGNTLLQFHTLTSLSLSSCDVGFYLHFICKNYRWDNFHPRRR